VSAGRGVIAAQDIIGWESVDNNYDNEDCFWLRVSGDSMSPKIDNGDLILIDKSAQIESGNIVVALVDNEGFIKRADLTSDSITLVSFNPYYPPMLFEGKETERVYFVGKVVKQERDL
jgi:repressor LexA